MTLFTKYQIDEKITRTFRIEALNMEITVDEAHDWDLITVIVDANEKEEKVIELTYDELNALLEIGHKLLTEEKD